MEAIKLGPKRVTRKHLTPRFCPCFEPPPSPHVAQLEDINHSSAASPLFCPSIFGFATIYITTYLSLHKGPAKGIEVSVVHLGCFIHGLPSTYQDIACYNIFVRSY